MKVTLNDNLWDIENIPHCPFSVYTELTKNFSLDTMLKTKHTNNDELVGYIKGVTDVLHRVKTLANITNEE